TNPTPKEEVVYARLSGTGAVNSAYVVNVLSPEKPGSVTDYGDYSAVLNLTDTTAIEHEGNAVTVEVAGDSLSYQGDMTSKSVPWDISISYKLDGKAIDPSDLGGKSGNLEIVLTTKENTSVDPTFYENYLLQITLVFAGDKAKNVATSDGQIALAGSNTQVTFTGMPGKEGSYSASATVNNFEMDGISFAAIPFSMVIESPDKEGLLSGFVQLTDGVGQLKQGAAAIASGAQELAGGAAGVATGVSGIADGASGIASGAQGIASGSAGLSQGLTAYQQGLNDQAAHAAGSVVDTSAQRQAYEAATQAYVAAFAMAYHAADPDTIGPEAAMAAAAQATASQAQAMQAAAQNLITAEATNGGFIATSQALMAAASGLGSPLDPQSIVGGAQSLSSGASSLAAGAGSLATGASSAAAGASAVSSGASQLSGGAGELATGTGSLYEEIQGIPDTVSKEIDKMISEYDKSDFKPVSFTSPKNTEVSLVQFVMATDSIVAPEQEQVQSEADEGTFWTRLLALFGIEG
ncbi:MAG: hypothetical protein RR505_04320, partial [Raoultibacter sp.]